MNKGFYALSSACSHSTTYWETENTTSQWEALGWKKEIDCSFSRKVAFPCRLNTQRKVSEEQDLNLNGFSIFGGEDIKRSQNCAITGRRVVSLLSFSKSMSVGEVILDLIEGLQDDGRDGDCHSLLLDLFSNSFESNGVHDKRTDAMFRHLREQDQEEVRNGMLTHEYLIYQLRIEHETRNVKRQLQCLKNAHSVLCSEAPKHLIDARIIHYALKHTSHHHVRRVVGAMREMAAYYLYGNNHQLRDGYIPDIVKFSVSIQEKNDAFSVIFLTYYKMPCSDSEFEAFVTDCCRIFGSAGSIDWAEREFARNKFKEHLITTKDTCDSFASDSVVWQAFRDNELQKMHSVVADVESIDSEIMYLMSSVAESLGVSERKSGEILAVFESIFLSLSRSLKLVTPKRQELQLELHALRHSEETARAEEEVSRLLDTEIAEQYGTWSLLCDSSFMKKLRRAIRAMICSY